MNISEHLRRAADDADPQGLDLDHLAHVARAAGARSHRRRRGAAVLTAAALVGVVTVGTTAYLSPGPDRPGSVPVVGTDGPTPSAGTGTPTLTPTPTPEGGTATPEATDGPLPSGSVPTPQGETPSPTPEGGATGTPDAGPAVGPFTGRGVTAGLLEAVQAESDGRADAFQGQGGGTEPSSEAYGQLDWSAADGRGVSVIGVNVQPGLDYVTRCSAAILRCSSRTSPDGGTLTTFEEHTRVAEGVGIRRVAELVRADGVRVVVAATNGYQLPRGDWDVTRPEPALDLAQLADVALRPWWGEELPTRLLTRGEALRPYVDLEPDVVSPTPAG